MNRRILSWCLFDFANSSYSAVIAAVVFPVFYTHTVVGNEAGQGDLWWGRAIALSMGLVAVSSPFLGGVADHMRIRKRLLFFFTALCIIAVACFSFLRKGMVIEGFFLIVLANIGLEGGLVFYNSFLREITDTAHQGRVSAWGYGIGYAGSIISLVIALLLTERGFLTFVWPMVSLFFAFFSLPAFLHLPPDRRETVGLPKAALGGLRSTWTKLRRMLADREQRKFLFAYLLYEDGVNTVIVFSSIFAATTLGFTTKELVWMYLIVQGTALMGAFLMARSIDYSGPKFVVSVTLTLWIAVALAAYFAYGKTPFFAIACAAGFGLGTIQAASRAFYTQFIPEGEESEYFGVYSLVGKSSAILGPLLFGFISSTFGSQRPAVLSVAVFFIAGLVLVRTVRGGGPNVPHAP
jgi:UMF1 family MFS transporter